MWMAGGIASAATVIIGYTTTIATTTTDLTNSTASLPSFDPGSANSTVSDIVGNGYTTGISMSSLDPVLNDYTLIGFNISVKETLTGTYTITNSSTNSNATGSVYVDSYTAVSLGNPLSPALTNAADPTDDLFNASVTGTGVGQAAAGEQPTSPGGGPDPNAPVQSGLNIASNGGTFTSPSINVNSKWVDYGAEISGQSFDNENNENSAINSALSTDLGLVTGPPANLIFYVSTATQTDTALTGGNTATTYNTDVQEQIEVTYEFTSTVAPPPAAPEPATMMLMGGALSGLGFLRKRLINR